MTDFRKASVAPAPRGAGFAIRAERACDVAAREALLDAILDFGQVPLKANEFLTVGVRSSDSVGNDPESDTVALVLQISGEDLSLFRQQKISRDEAKKRIRINQQQR